MKLIFFGIICLRIHFVYGDNELFRDTFDGTSLNLEAWNLDTSDTTTNSDVKVQYSPTAATVKKGLLGISATKSGTNGFVSGRMDTKGKFSFKYGVIEIRAQFPRGGKGIWPALWLYPVDSNVQNCQKWQPVVTVAEFRCDVADEIMFSVFHPDHFGFATSWEKAYTSQLNFVDGFHSFRLQWTAEGLEWFIDSTLVAVNTNKLAIPSVEMYIGIDLAVGGIYAGNPDWNTKLPADLIIDEIVVRGFTDSLAVGPAVTDTAKNFTNTSSAPLPAQKSSSVPSFLAPLLGTLLPLLLLAAIVGAVFYRRRSRLKNVSKMPRKSDANSMDVQALSDFGTDWKVSDYMKGQQAVLHYVNLLEIPLANLEISQHVLGRGTYGVVRKGIAKGLRGIDRPTMVAIKSALNAQDEEQRRALVEEMKVMCKAGRHLNILNLLGTVIKGETLLLTELCPLGSLMNFLRDRRGALYKNQVGSDGALLDDTLPNLNRNPDPKEGPCAIDPVYLVHEEMISTRDLINLAFQVARGMEYLAYRRIIHRDLAARNVLIAADRIAKVSDFGMARQEDEYVLANDQVALPVRWMPPEAITKRMFNQKTDVWSFGVLMWEIFTLAETPYQNSGISLYITDFVLSISHGYRMPRPSSCPSAVYGIMQKCWKDASKERPTFDQLAGELRILLQPDAAETYLTLDLPYQRFNRAHEEILDEVAEEYPEDYQPAQPANEQSE